ncbi:STAS domain-containing protein [Modestobacter sp. DSM 44400]|uniref:STAS domain-containing protein n=1 Tax=Modestobacter sp. DSM 44400 TaxID=1550230 RepID=UPI0020C8BD3B|nr:STAS domain-containing protein [Modestobacter sp. DSM 44400]
MPSSLVTVGPGMRGPALEGARPRGPDPGHLPQSWQFATLGGYAATRSAGQSSTGVGRFDDPVAGLTLATPTGVLELGKPPASAAGPDLLDLALGSEGALGIITELRLRVRPTSRTTTYEGWSFRSWAAELAGLQRLARHDLLPDVVRLSDPDETRATLLQSTGAGSRLLRASLRGRRHGQGCLLVVGWEGLPTIARARQRAATSVLRDGGAIRLGSRVGAAWVEHRFAAPYLRDRLLDAGLLVETLETAATWTALPRVYAVRRALHESLARPGRRPLVMPHLSHGYPTGASLHVTVLADRDDDLPMQRWLTAKRAVRASATRGCCSRTEPREARHSFGRFTVAQAGTGRGMPSLDPGRAGASSSITLVEDAPVRHLRFTGDIGRDVVREFRLSVRPASWPSRVDLSGVHSMDSAGLELLLHLARKQKRFGGELEVVEPPAPLRRLMEQSGLTRVSHWVIADADAPAFPSEPSPAATA